MKLSNWMRGSRAPDELIGEHGMRRWWLLPRNRLFNLYLHQHRGDDARLLHDHPAWNISIRLAGELIEARPTDLHRELVELGQEVLFYNAVACKFELVGYPEIKVFPMPGTYPRRFVFFRDGEALIDYRRVPRIVIRRARDPHWLELGGVIDGDEHGFVAGPGAWTLWIRGPNRRAWGFYTPEGWLRWERAGAWLAHHRRVARSAGR